MDYNGVVASPSLNFGDVINHSNHILHVRKLIPSSPIGNVELAHLMSLIKLGNIYKLTTLTIRTVSQLVWFQFHVSIHTTETEIDLLLQVIFNRLA